MIVVLDTNVVVSGMLTPHGVCGEILLQFSSATFEASVSNSILTEYQEVLHRPHLKISRDKAAGILSSMERIALKVAESSRKYHLPDSDDAIFLDAALAAKADFLVTGNLRHFPARLCHGVRVISPAEFLKLLRASE